jgi:hypothetical protein
MESTIIGVFGNRASAEAAITELRTLGVSDTNISYLYISEEGNTVSEGGKGDNVAGGAAAGVTTGAVVGALAGLAVANGILPGLGTLFVAGPLATALGLTGAAATTAAGAMTGAAAGGIVGALAGLGVGEEEAKVYEERIRSGGILVTATTSDPAAARDIFATNGADEIREYARS